MILVEGRVNRRALLKWSGLGAAAALVPERALAGHWPEPYPNRPPGHYPGLSEGEAFDEGAIPTPNRLPPRPEPTIKTAHDRGDAVITRYQQNVDATNFGVAGDERSGLLYVSQRATDHIAVFDRQAEQFVDLLYIPTVGSGSHAVKVDERNNKVWYAAGEASKVGCLVLDQELRPSNFVEYTVPGDVRPQRKPHGIVAVGDEVWYTDDRGHRVGWVDVKTGRVRVLPEEIKADGIAVERRFRRRRGRRQLVLRVWVAGGATVTVIDVRKREVTHEIPIPEEPGFSQLRLHDLGYDRRLNRVWVLMRGSDHMTWIDADRPGDGAQEFINPHQTAAGLDHMDLGRRYVWWTEGLANNVVRHDPGTGETVGYEATTPVGYFNPHGIWVSKKWKEVWFTELESIGKITFKDGRSP